MLFGAEHGADGDVVHQYQLAALERNAAGKACCEVVPFGCVANTDHVERKQGAIVILTPWYPETTSMIIFHHFDNGFWIVWNICALLTKIEGLINTI